MFAKEKREEVSNLLGTFSAHSDLFDSLRVRYEETELGGRFRQINF